MKNLLEIVRKLLEERDEIEEKEKTKKENKKMNKGASILGPKIE